MAGTHSGVGKTTVATGLLAALKAAGHRPAGAKVGPDFIDPGYHALACGRAPRNLDPWLCGADAVPALAGRAARGAGLLIVEGVMGLFDGAADGTPSSTAEVARLLGAPIVLVIDASGLSTSIAALVHGYSTFDPAAPVAGVVLNRVGSEAHAVQLREALGPLGMPVLGALRRDGRLTWRDRHLGLVPVAEEPGAVASQLDRLGAAVAEAVDLPAVVALATSARPMDVPDPPLPAPSTAVRIAVAAGSAFTFTYTDTVEALTAGGAEVVPFDPLRDRALPEGTDGVLVGGGFPEIRVADLGANATMLASLGSAVDRGVPTWAECGGLLYLCRSLDGTPMVGAVPADARMTDRLTLGYRNAVSTTSSPIGPAGTRFRGHEFRYCEVTPPGEALVLSNRWGQSTAGHSSASLLASFVHHHPGGDPSLVASFLATCAARRP